MRKRPTERNAPRKSGAPARFSTLDSLTNNKRPATMIRPIGRLMLNARRQPSSPKLVANQPPRTGPRATIPPIVEPQTAKAMPRSLPWKFAFTRESVVGSTIDPPMPWRIRARISELASLEYPAHTDAPTKMTIPITRSLRRPTLSARDPQMSRRAAKTRT